MKTHRGLSAVAAFLLAAGSVAHAATYTFTGTTTGTTTWSSGTNWDAVPVSGSTTALVFGTGQALASGTNLTTTQDVVSPFVLNSLTTSYSGSGTEPSVGIQTGALNFVSDGSITPTIAIDSTGVSPPQFVFTSAVNFGDSIAIGGASSVRFDGAITNTDGAVVTKSGGGTLRIASSNPTYTGNFNVTGGVLQIGNNGNAGDAGSGTVTLATGGSFVVRRNSGTLALNNTITGTGTVRFQTRGFTATINKANTYSGATTLEPSGTSGSGGGINLGVDNGLPAGTAFTITNNGSVVTQTFNLNGFNQTLASIATGTGGSTTNSIITNSGASKTLTISTTSGSTTYDGLISGNTSLTKAGASTQVLSGANTYTGVTRITGGVLSTGLLANSGTASGIGAATSGSGNLVIDGGTLRYTGGAITQWNRPFTIGVNGATFDRSSGSGQLDIDTTVAYSGSGARDLTVITSGSGSVRLRNVIADSGGATTVVKQGAGQLILSGNNTYSGQLQILAGNVQIGNAGAGGASTGVGHSVAISSGADLRFRQAANTVLSFNAPISGAGAVRFDYANSTSDTGTLTLGGNNTFSGGLLLNPNGGTNVLTLLAGSTTALGTGNVTFNNQYGRLDLNGFDVTTGLLISSTGANGIVTNNGAADVAFTLTGTSSQTYGGVIQDGSRAISIIKSGSGIQTFSGANTYTGTTTVGAGTLAITGSLAGGAVSVQSGATLGGSGSIGGATSILGGGILAPGTSPGTLTITNTLALADTSILAYELDAADQTVGGGINDLVIGVTDLALGGVLNVTGVGDFSTVSQGAIWRLINYSGSLSGNGLTIGSAPSLTSGLSFEVDTATAGQVNLVVVPEPATLVGLIAGGLGIAAALRSRKRT